MDFEPSRMIAIDGHLGSISSSSSSSEVGGTGRSGAIGGAGSSLIIQTLLSSNSHVRMTEPGLIAGSIGVIVGVILACILFIAFFMFIAYCFPFTRCYLACSPCVNRACCNCIFFYFVCCPCLDVCARRRLKMRSAEKPIYIQDMLATPDGKIIHMSNVGRVVTP